MSVGAALKRRSKDVLWHEKGSHLVAAKAKGNNGNHKASHGFVLDWRIACGGEERGVLCCVREKKNSDPTTNSAPKLKMPTTARIDYVI